RGSMGARRVAVVSGGGRGIGAATAIRLAANGHSAAAVDIDRQATAMTIEVIADRGGHALAVGADVTDEESVTRAFDTIVSDLGAPTILVNNAGIVRDSLFFKMSLADWESVQAVHLRGAF